MESLNDNISTSILQTWCQQPETKCRPSSQDELIIRDNIEILVEYLNIYVIIEDELTVSLLTSTACVYRMFDVEHRNRIRYLSKTKTAWKR